MLQSKTIVFFISFFLQSGYYLGLLTMYSMGLSNLTRYYSIPLRLLMIVIMTIFIKRNFKNLRKSKDVIFVFFCFSLIYLIKILFTNEVFGNYRYSQLEYFFYYVSYCFLPFLFFSSIDLSKYFNHIKNGLFVSGLLLSVLTIISFRQLLESGGIARISQLSYQTGEAVISPLALAYSGSLTIIVCLFCLFFEKNNFKKSLIYLIAIILSLIPFFLGASRGALLSVGLCVILYFFLSSIKGKTVFLVLSVISFPFFLFMIELSGTGLFVRTSSTIDSGNSSGREYLWADAINEFKDNPVFGGRIEVSGIYPHNIFLEVLMAMGAVGFVVFILFIIFSMLKLKKIERHKRIFIYAILIFAFSMSMFSGGLYSSIIFFSTLGLLNSKINSSLEIVHFK